jgi:misacylated tRNA(Ala) deacylase
VTELLYYHDSYLREFEATISKADFETGANRVELDKTAFYPGGGGQPSDVGWLIAGDNRFKVVKVKRESGIIWHTLVGEFETMSEALGSGQLVACGVDWENRYRIMRTHSAMHILCGVVWKDYGASVTGGNMEPGKGRMDFEFERMERDLVKEIEVKCNDEVIQAREIRSQLLTREEAMKIPDLIRTKVNLIPESVKQIRTVEIVGLDLQADGGTHVRNTREVGQIRVVDYKSKGAINKRIYLEIE